MTFLNQDVQATHQILSLLELSKSKSDEVLESLPAVFAILSPDGRILKGNQLLADLMQVDLEQTTGRSVSELFRAETWEILQGHFRAALEEAKPAREFELSVDGESSAKVTCFWTASRFEVPSQKPYVSLLGRDITALRRVENQLSEIFASIPLGIISVDRQGLAEACYSAFSEILLGTTEIAGTHLRSLFFEHCLGLTAEDSAKIEMLFDTLGGPLAGYYEVKPSLPTEVHFQRKGEFEVERFLTVSYQPVAFAQKLEKLLIILEDRSEIVRMQVLEREKKAAEQAALARFVQLKGCAPEVLPMIMDEIRGLFERLDFALRKKERREVLGVLHSIKGNARVAGFLALTQYAHEAEFQLIAEELKHGWDWDEVVSRIRDVRTEWSELLDVYRGLVGKDFAEKTKKGESPELETIRKFFSKYQSLIAMQTEDSKLLAERVSWALGSFRFTPLASLEDLIRLRVQNTAQQLGRLVELEFNWHEVMIDQEAKVVLNEALLHLLTNAVAHGIESPEERQSKGKGPVGKIRLSAHERQGVLSCDIEDDGRGIDIDQIKNVAVKKRWISLEDAIALPEAQAVELLFAPDFSTAQEVNEISGRGVGLSAVRTSLARCGGTVVANRGVAGGARFSITMNSWRNIPIEKSFFPVLRFLSRLDAQVEEVAKTRGFEFHGLQKPGRRDQIVGVLFADWPRLLIAIGTCLGYFGSPGLAGLPGLVDANLELAENGLIRIRARRQLSGVWLDDPEFSLALDTAGSYLRKHGGRVQFAPDELLIEFGTLLGRERIPAIRIGLEEGLTWEGAQAALNQIQRVALELDIPLEMPTYHQESAKGHRPALSVLSNASSRLPGVLLDANADQVEKALLLAVGQALGMLN